MSPGFAQSPHPPDEPQKAPVTTTQEQPADSQPRYYGGHLSSPMPSHKDTVGVEVYVDALSEFLLHEDTRPPFTASIEGEWGSGKTTFMGLLKKRLEEAGASVVWFKPWRHDKEESLWGAFAMAFVSQLAKGLPWYQRVWAAWRVIRRRGAYGPIVRLVLFALAFALGCGLCAWLMLNGGLPVLESLNLKTANELAARRLLGGGSIAWVLLVYYFGFRYAKRLVGNPLTPELRRYFSLADYTDRVTFIERFHKDFQDVVEAYANDTKVFVFIDDLDRCEVPRAADLMQALNLMLDEGARLFFILGMDREKVAAGLAAKHENVLPYLRVPGSGERHTRDHEQKMREVGLDYGHAFIEKFIQLPLRVPPATEQTLDRFLDGLGRHEEQEAPKRVPLPQRLGRLLSRWFGRGSEHDATERDPHAQSHGESPRPTGPAMADFDDAEFRKLVWLAEPALRGNPRRIVHFTNMLRVWHYIGHRTRILARHGDQEPIVTPEQLAKFLAIGLRWPRLMLDIAQRPQLLRSIAHFAEEPGKDPGPEGGGEWLVSEPELRMLLTKPSVPGKPVDDRYSLRAVDVALLLRAYPAILPPPTRMGQPPQLASGAPQKPTAEDWVPITKDALRRFIAGSWQLTYTWKGQKPMQEQAQIDDQWGYTLPPGVSGKPPHEPPTYWLIDVTVEPSGEFGWTKVANKWRLKDGTVERLPERLRVISRDVIEGHGTKGADHSLRYVRAASSPDTPQKSSAI